MASSWEEKNFDPQDLMIPVIDEVFKPDSSNASLSTRSLTQAQLISVCAELKRLETIKAVVERNCGDVK
jgi:hypothetical protein